MAFNNAKSVSGNFHLDLKGFEKFEKVVNPKRFNRIFKAYMKKASSQSGMLGRRLVKKSIRSQRWAANSPWTIAKKGHDKTLIHWGMMLRSANYRHIKNGFEVGVHKVSHDGKYNVARIVHDGAVIKHPQNKSKILIIPPRPFFTYALFDVADTTDAVSSKRYANANSEFMKTLRFNWHWAMHMAFTKNLMPDKQNRPKK